MYIFSTTDGSRWTPKYRKPETEAEWCYRKYTNEKQVKIEEAPDRRNSRRRPKVGNWPKRGGGVGSEGERGRGEREGGMELGRALLCISMSTSHSK